MPNTVVHKIHYHAYEGSVLGFSLLLYSAFVIELGISKL